MNNKINVFATSWDHAEYETPWLYEQRTSPYDDNTQPLNSVTQY